MKLNFNAFATLLVVFAAVSLSSCTKPNTSISSPDGLISLHFSIGSDGKPVYEVAREGKPIILPSALGIELYDAPALGEGLAVKKVLKKSMDETWEMPWGEQRYVRNHYNEMTVVLSENKTPGRDLHLIFRAYDDGIAFRYYIPTLPGTDSIFIAEEHSHFRLAADNTCWWVPGDWDINEHLYNKTSFSRIDALSKRNHPNLAQTYIPHNAVNTPITMRTTDGLHLSFHEAALTDYAAMTLAIDNQALSMKTILTGSENRPYKVSHALPFSSPWRMIQISPDAAGLIASRLILNLNEPNQLGDVSWVKPTKYVGIWWEMHLGKSEWSFARTAGGPPHGRHGATTENTKRYIDFAAANHIGAVLIEGWNTGWENWIGTANREGIFDFVTPYPDFDMAEVVRYAREKGVRLIMHHETSAAVSTYEKQLDTAFKLMKHFGYDMVKTGYVGTIIPKGEYHHNQRMIRHYVDVLKKAAGHKIAVNSHESMMPTGLRRTFPNDISCENLRGQEFNGWASDGGNPPSHLPTVAFTRMLAGPIDYTPGIFNIKFDQYKPNNQVNTTLAQQLALYVVIYSPIQMAADLPEHYEGQPAFQFIRDVGVDWEQTRVLNGEVGEYVTIARQERETGNWFLGSITNEEGRQLSISTSFLEPDRRWQAIIYADGKDAHWDNNPTSIAIDTLEVDKNSTISLELKPGGGAAISFKPF
ncbi:MAG TPA: glycoside hydrolase family 97 protein [Bacteroidales bacterium]|nr:glycoside hydrolase family 97 protein [Bacteroidales bacterium]